MGNPLRKLAFLESNESSKIIDRLGKYNFLHSHGPLLPINDVIKNEVDELANHLAEEWKKNHPDSGDSSEANKESCEIYVVTGLVFASADALTSVQGEGTGTVEQALEGAAMGAVAGIPAARRACQRIQQSSE